MCVRCLKEGFGIGDDFPWPEQRGGEEDGTADSHSAPPSIVDIFVADIYDHCFRICKLFSRHVRMGYAVPALLCGGLNRWQAGVGFNAMLFASLWFSERRQSINSLEKIKRKKKKIVLCSIIVPSSQQQHHIIK